jgi:hypothetical protein
VERLIAWTCLNDLNGIEDVGKSAHSCVVVVVVVVVFDFDKV